MMTMGLDFGWAEFGEGNVYACACFFVLFFGMIVWFIVSVF